MIKSFGDASGLERLTSFQRGIVGECKVIGVRRGRRRIEPSTDKQFQCIARSFLVGCEKGLGLGVEGFGSGRGNRSLFISYVGWLFHDG